MVVFPTLIILTPPYDMHYHASFITIFALYVSSTCCFMIQQCSIWPQASSVFSSQYLLVLSNCISLAGFPHDCSHVDKPFVTKWMIYPETSGRRWWPRRIMMYAWWGHQVMRPEDISMTMIQQRIWWCTMTRGLMRRKRVWMNSKQNDGSSAWCEVSEVWCVLSVTVTESKRGSG